MPNIFGSKFNNQFRPMATSTTNGQAQSVQMQRAIKICKQLGESGTPVLPDPKEISPILINGHAILVSSNSTSPAEQKVVDDFSRSHGKVTVVTLNSNDTIIGQYNLDTASGVHQYNNMPQPTKLEIQAFRDLLKNLNIGITVNGKMINKPVSKMTDAEVVLAIQELSKSMGARGGFIGDDDDEDEDENIYSSSGYSGCGWHGCGSGRYSSGCGGGGCGR